MNRMLPDALRGMLLLLALLLPASAAAKTTPHEKPKPGMAVLNGEHNGESGWGMKAFIGMRIGVLDGDSQRTGPWLTSAPTTVHVPPGRHSVRLEYYYGMKSSASGQFWWDAEADHSYTAHYTSQDRMVEIWIEDDATGQRVGGVGDGKDKGVATAAATIAPADAEQAKSPPPASDEDTAGDRAGMAAAELAHPLTSLLPDATSAVIVCDPERDSGMLGLGALKRHAQIVQLDYKRHSNGSKRVRSYRIEPGLHPMSVEVVEGEMSATVDLEFAVEAGKTYWVRRSSEGYSARVWVEDAEGVVVSRPVAPVK